MFLPSLSPKPKPKPNTFKFLPPANRPSNLTSLNNHRPPLNSLPTDSPSKSSRCASSSFSSAPSPPSSQPPLPPRSLRATFPSAAPPSTCSTTSSSAPPAATRPPPPRPRPTTARRGPVRQPARPDHVHRPQPGVGSHAVGGLVRLLPCPPFSSHVPLSISVTRHIILHVPLMPCRHKLVCCWLAVNLT